MIVITLAEYTQMSTHVPGFQSFFRFFASFCIGQISHQQHKGQFATHCILFHLLNLIIGLFSYDLNHVVFSECGIYVLSPRLC